MSVVITLVCFDGHGSLKKTNGISYPVSDESNCERKEVRNVRGNAGTKPQNKRTQCLRSTETLGGRGTGQRWLAVLVTYTYIEYLIH